MNFLSITRKVARDSGTMRLGLPASVVDQSGEEAAIIFYVQEAWRELQNSRSSWKWMQGEFEFVLQPNVFRYSAASASLPRLAEWITRPGTVTMYHQGIGVDDEGPLSFIEFDRWRRMFGTGPQEAQRPAWYSVDPAGQLCVGPKPDTNYVIRGQYRKTPQELVADGDVPEMPERFHDLIAAAAYRMHSEMQEAEWATSVAGRRYATLMSDLQRDQLPSPRIGVLASALA